MKKLLLTLSTIFLSFMAFSQTITVVDSIGYHDCDSSQVFLYNFTPQPTSPIYYQWQIDGNLYNVGTNQAPFEIWVSNANFNYVILYAFSDSTYTTSSQAYTYTIVTNNCAITSLGLVSTQLSATNCFQGLFILDANPSGGVPAYEYNWYIIENNIVVDSVLNGGNSLPFITLNSGSIVSLEVIDANGSTLTEEIPITVLGSLNATSAYTIITTDCTHTTIQFSGSSNVPTVSYIWTIGNNGTSSTYTTQNPTVTFLNSSLSVTVVLEVIDSICADVITTVISLTGTSFGVISDVVNNSNNLCTQGLCDFEIYLTPTGGVGPYLYSLDSGALDSSNVFSNICAGGHTATVEDATGCISTISVFVSDVFGVQVYESSYFASCDTNGQGGNNSYIQAYGSGATTVWSDGFVGFNYQNPSPGTYTYIVTDDFNGCTASGTFIVPSNNCYTISGNVYADLDGDCIFNNNDYALNNVWVDLADANGTWLGNYDYTNTTGSYSISAPAGTYYFDINGYNVTNFTQNCPASGFSVTIGPNNPTATVDFFMTPPAPVQDLSISIYSFTTFTPGFPYWSYVSYCNPGTIPMSGTVVMSYDANLTYIAGSSAGAIDDPMNNTLTWTFTNLNPNNCSSFHPDFVCATTAVLGTTMSNTVVINPIAGDVTPNNNTAYLIDTVVGSWDPNDKAVYPQAGMTVNEKDHDYTIRFQNKGTAPATFVIVRDNLDDNLDLQTLRNVSASHNFVMTVENTDELVFTFNNIMLPAEQDDAEGSNGSIHFTISQKENLAIGTVIENTAGIYFDFNEPVITNTTVNTIIEKTTGIANLSPKSDVLIYPNPTNGLINILADSKIKKITVYNLIGKEVFKADDLQSSKALISLQNTANGVYLIKIETETGIKVNRITLTNN